MSIPESAQPPVDERFEHLLISAADAQRLIGKLGPAEVTYNESEQGDARRKLLDVEKVAQENKRQLALTEAQYITSVNQHLHDIVLSELTESLSFTNDVFTQTLNLSSEVGSLLDTISVKAATVSRLLKDAEALPWLYDELIQLVNSPKFRRRDSKGRIIVVETLKTALSFLGIENLRVLLPALVLKRAMPQITDPYPNIKVNLTKYAQGTAVAAKALASYTPVNPDHAYMFGMLSNLGRCAIIRLYFRLFDMVHTYLLKESEKDKESRRFAALQQIGPSPRFLMALQEEFADRVGADILEHMLFKRLHIAPAMRQCAERAPREANSLPMLLNQARTYTQIRMLHKSKLIEFADVKPLIDEQCYPNGVLEKLKSVDIFTTPLLLVEETK